MAVYSDDLSVYEARERYFEASGFAASSYEANWVRLRIGPIPIAFPNTAGRKAAVPCHDLHHVATGYDTSLVGEAEIGAWEIASDCSRAPAALLLNLLVIWPVLFIAPGRLHRAFLRGRHSRNLYGRPWNESWLASSVGALRGQLGLDAPTPAAQAADQLAFAGWMAGVVGIQLGILALLIGAAAWWLGVFA